jgi:hypothetical protein
VNHFQKMSPIDERVEDIGTARLVARARREIASGIPLLPKHKVDCSAKKKKPTRPTKTRIKKR